MIPFVLAHQKSVLRTVLSAIRGRAMADAIAPVIVILTVFLL
jgi:hypothetical protein